MQAESEIQTSCDVSRSDRGTALPSDYLTHLQQFELTPVPAGFYWQVGDDTNEFEWVVFLTVIRTQIPALLSTVVPLLVSHQLPFKVIRNYNLAKDCLDGCLGYQMIGKIIVAFPKSTDQLVSIVKLLVDETGDLKGPRIFNAQYLGSIVYSAPGRIEQTAPFPHPKLPGLLNHSYYPLALVQASPKGNTIRALYFKQIGKIKSCLLKQGRRHMWADEAERDIRSRLQWQYNLNQTLKGKIPMPEIFDIFEYEGDTWLAMQWINGCALDKWIYRISRSNSWLFLATSTKLMLIDKMLEIVSAISRLHESGIIHRDIMPANFLVDKRGRLFLIDMELAWSIDSRFPDPPFKLGTPGFMSPEQFRCQTPAIEQDIFSLGALITVFFTNSVQLSQLQLSHSALKARLLFFTRDEPIADLIARCLDDDPAVRPTINNLSKGLSGYRNQIQSKAALRCPPDRFTPDRLQSTVQTVLDGLANPVFLSPSSRWLSPIDVFQTNQFSQRRATVKIGWHTGVAGPIWLVSLAKLAGIPLANSLPPVYGSLEWLKENTRPGAPNTDPGLYHGSAGVALAVGLAIRASLVPDGSLPVSFIPDCFAQPIQEPGLAAGSAGRGLALLALEGGMPKIQYESILGEIVSKLVNKQEPDSEVLWFLLNFIQKDRNTEIEIALQRKLNSLLKKADIPSTIGGLHGEILVLLKAYQIWRMPKYKKKIESCLTAFQPFPQSVDFSLETGLAGLGQVYLDANRILKNEAYLDRANWIGELLCATINSSGYWLNRNAERQTADLFQGMAGIIHFLMRLAQPEKLAHPLDIANQNLLLNQLTKDMS